MSKLQPLSSSPDAARRYAERVRRLEAVAKAARAWDTTPKEQYTEHIDIRLHEALAALDAVER